MKGAGRLPRLATMQAVLVKRDGLGWIVGVGPIATGEITERVGAHLDELHAIDAAVEEADRRDLIAVVA